MPTLNDALRYAQTATGAILDAVRSLESIDRSLDRIATALESDPLRVIDRLMQEAEEEPTSPPDPIPEPIDPALLGVEAAVAEENLASLFQKRDGPPPDAKPALVNQEAEDWEPLPKSEQWRLG